MAPAVANGAIRSFTSCRCLVGNTEAVQKRGWRTSIVISSKPTHGPDPKIPVIEVSHQTVHPRDNVARLFVVTQY